MYRDRVYLSIMINIKASFQAYKKVALILVILGTKLLKNLFVLFNGKRGKRKLNMFTVSLEMFACIF